ncbi:MAG: hypothetical protein R8L53_02235, partial [Mariprofundales bacterium]
APTIDYYSYANTKNDGLTGKIWANISSVGAGQSGTLTFDVYVTAGIAPQNIPNVGSVSYDDSVNAARASTNSNQVDFVVTQVAAVLLDDITSSTDEDGNIGNDTILDGYATQGGTIAFNDIVHHDGNGIDTFNITIDNTGLGGATQFPAGTSFLLYKSDAVTPLVDTNGDSIPDTGPVAAGGTYDLYVQVVLPTSASGDNAGAGYTVPVTATSIFDGTKSDSTNNKLGQITPNTVDMTNDTARADSTPAGTATAWTNGFDVYATSAAANAAGVIGTATLNPGDSYTFALYINNTSAVPDSYNLLGDIDGVFGTVNHMPTGWTLDFRANATGVCATTGASVSNTGTINSGENKLICAVVTTLSTQAPITQKIYFRVLSPTSGALDLKVDGIIVRTVRGLQITSNNTGQVFPGGSVVYTHIIDNIGNVAEGTVETGSEAADTSSVIIDGYTSNTLSVQGWTSVVYWDKDNNGVLDNTDPLVTDLYSLSSGSGGAWGDEIR